MFVDCTNKLTHNIRKNNNHRFTLACNFKYKESEALTLSQNETLELLVKCGAKCTYQDVPFPSVRASFSRPVFDFRDVKSHSSLKQLSVLVD